MLEELLTHAPVMARTKEASLVFTALQKSLRESISNVRKPNMTRPPAAVQLCPPSMPRQQKPAPMAKGASRYSPYMPFTCRVRAKTAPAMHATTMQQPACTSGPLAPCTPCRTMTHENRANSAASAAKAP